MSKTREEVAAMREEYGSREMHREDMAAGPITQFEQWFDEAVAAEVHEPNALTLSTLSLDGFPTARTVLLKFFDERGFVFYTNYTSAKAQQLAATPKACMLFTWLLLERQIRIEGTVEKINEEESLAYFKSRPRDSQIGAWVSHQSSLIESRDSLHERITELEQRFAGGDVPLPEFWGGYRLKPTKIEFWQGGKARIHDRFLYTQQDEGWSIDRLAP
ncbi:MAG: pyridoxamine 5'-phosphate oxidase [Akkermansiaceae bacterium]